MTIETHEYIRATLLADDFTAHDADPWRADNEWLGGWLRCHLRVDGSALCTNPWIFSQNRLVLLTPNLRHASIADPPILSSRPRNGTVVFSLLFANAALKCLSWP